MVVRLLIFLLLLSHSTFAVDVNKILREVESGQISLELISALKSFDKKDRIGFGLCSQKNSFCNKTGSIGYGLCTLNNFPSYCKVNGSIGYGLCTLKNGVVACSETGSIGYGLCAIKNGAASCSD